MKLKLFRFLSTAFLLGVCINQIKAQVTSTNYFIPTFYPKAPNTATFTKYGDYQVNLFTGMPDISIPLYTIDAGGLKVPITLSYHASGIKVSDLAGWAGLGWAVSTGGTVSRNIIGKADDGPGGYLQGYLRQDSTINLYNNSDMDYLNHIMIRNIDTRPDIFSYDFPGHSGKFFFDGTNNYKIEFIPYSPISIKTSIPYLTGGFNIMDDHGNNYIFGSSKAETTYSYTQSQPAVGSITSWMLEKMISQNRRDTISFNYSVQTVHYPDMTSQTEVLTDQVSPPFMADSTSIAPYTAGDIHGPTGVSGSYVNEQLVQQINFKNGNVVFITDTANRLDFDYTSAPATHRLKEIQISAYNYKTRAMEVQKTIIFYTSYFNPTVLGGKRLKLDSIQILDKAGSVVQHYRFGYNVDPLHPIPIYNSMEKDYWGYFNNKPNSSLIPQMSVIYQPSTNAPPGANLIVGSSVVNGRDCDSLYMQACVLDTIYYPTGGHTVFTYQTNQYTASGVLKLAGGLRIKSISNYDGINPTPIIKTYQYNRARANFVLDYTFFQTTQGHRYFVQLDHDICSHQVVTCQIRNFVSNSTIDLVPFDAATVVYPSVTEYIGTPGSNIGRTDYIFHDLSDTEDISSYTGTPVVNSYFYARGQLLSRKDYLRKSDGTYQVVKLESNSYTAFSPAHIYKGVGMIAGVSNVAEGAGEVTPVYTGGCIVPASTDYYYLLHSNYNITSDDNYLTSSTTKIYDINDTTRYTTSTISYNYGDTTYQQIKSTVHTDSKGNTHAIINKYPFDYLSGTTTHNALLDSMIFNRHMYSEVIEKADSLHNAITGMNGITGAQLNQYQNGSIPYTILPSKISTLSVGSPLTNFTHSSVVSGTLTGDYRYVQMISFDAYDPQNNIAQYTPRNSTPVSIIWDYMYELPVAQVKNATYSYAGNTQVAYTSFEAPRNGWWYYTGTPVKDVTAPTGVFVYPLTAGSVTSNSFDNTKSYVLSLWSNGGAPTVYAGSYLTGSNLKTTNGWTYYEYNVPVSASAITISGAMSIDELRFYPSAAQMITYAYDPSGIRSIMDAKSEPQYFEYDSFQRLKNIKDWYGNIINNYAYHTYDQTVGNDAIGATVFTRDNCPSGTAPQSTTYSVPVNRYYSSTKASANLEAQYDLSVNGQAKADNPSICGCPIATYNFTLTNSSAYTGWQAVFTIGGTPTTYNFPASGSTTVPIPVGTYTTVYVGPVGSATHTFTLGSRTPITGAHSATFSSVVIATSGSTDTSLTIN